MLIKEQKTDAANIPTYTQTLLAYWLSHEEMCVCVHTTVALMILWLLIFSLT